MPRPWMNSRRGLVTAAAVAGGLLVLATPALAAVRTAGVREGASHLTAAATAPPSTYEPLSASWPSPKSISPSSNRKIRRRHSCAR